MAKKKSASFELIGHNAIGEPIFVDKKLYKDFMKKLAKPGILITSLITDRKGLTIEYQNEQGNKCSILLKNLSINDTNPPRAIN